MLPCAVVAARPVHGTFSWLVEPGAPWVCARGEGTESLLSLVWRTQTTAEAVDGWAVQTIRRVNARSAPSGKRQEQTATELDNAKHGDAVQIHQGRGSGEQKPTGDECSTQCRGTLQPVIGQPAAEAQSSLERTRLLDMVQ